MRFFTGLHQPSDAKHIDPAFVSVNRLRKRKSGFQVGDWIMDSGAFTEISTHGYYRHGVAEYAAEIRRWKDNGNLLAAVSQDWMCEPWIIEKTGLSVLVHQQLTVANLLVAQFGPVITPVLAFVCIGLDLALRDWLQLRLTRWHMAGLILGTGVITYLLNPAAGQIAQASAAAFILAALADWWAFNTLAGSWLRRSIGSNVVGAAADSLVFPTLAFGALLPGIVVAQFVAKTAGGALWAWLISKRVAA